MRVGTFVSVVLAVITAGGAVTLAVYSAVCTGCGHVPTHNVPPAPTPGLTAPPTPTSTRGPADGSERLAHALLARFGPATAAARPRTGTYRAVAGVPLPRGAVRDALAGHARVTPAGCAAFPPSGWASTASGAPAATVTLRWPRGDGRVTRIQETLLAPGARRPSGLRLPARCRAFTLRGGSPARAAALRPHGVGDAARGRMTLVGHRGPDRAGLYTIVFRVGRVYGVVNLATTGRAPLDAASRRAVHRYARHAATRARGLL